MATATICTSWENSLVLASESMNQPEERNMKNNTLITIALKSMLMNRLEKPKIGCQKFDGKLNFLGETKPNCSKHFNHNSMNVFMTISVD